MIAALFWAQATPILASAQEKCTASAIEGISLFGGMILNITATPYTGLSANVRTGQNHYAKNVTALDVCEVLITYTHPGYGDIVYTTIWLPTSADWSGRFLGAGGGGWMTGTDNLTLAWAASEGFAVVTTDGGHTADTPVTDWALSSVGNVSKITSSSCIRDRC